MAEVESTHSNGKHQLEDNGDAPVKAKLLKTENGSKSNGNGVEAVTESGAKTDAAGESGAGEESNDVLANTQSDLSKHNDESNTNDTNGEVTSGGRVGRKVKGAPQLQENSTSAYEDEDDEEGDDGEEEGDDGEDTEEDDDDEEGDHDEDEGEDDDDDGEGPDGEDDDDEEDDEEGDE